jgi:peptide/nickel transport system substrate-binding protein
MAAMGRMGLRCSAALVGGLVAVGLVVSAAAEAAVKRGGTMTLARPDEPLSLDPVIPSDNGSIYVLAQVCESLLLADESGKGLVPGLAESWEISKDGLTATYKLRDGVKFSDGSPMTADDVVFSLQRVAKPDTAYGFIFTTVKSIAKVDDSHVRIELKAPYAALNSVLSLFAAAVVSKKAVEKDAAAFAQKPVCTGPFQVESFERGAQVVLTPNPNYWGKGEDGKPLPYLDKVVVKYVPESNSRVLGLQNGDFDAITNVPYNQAAQVKAMEGVKLEVSPSYRLDYVYINEQKKPLDNPKFRLALNYAANREAILKTVYFGYGEIPNSYMPKVNFWSDKVATIPYDIEKAKALVKESGYDGTPIQLMVDTGNAPFRQIATILQQGWAQAGIKSEIVEFDVGTAFGMTQKGDYQAYVSYITSDINDDDELGSIEADYTSGTNSFFAWYKNDEVVKLLKDARESLDPAKRAELYAKIQDVVYHDGYSVPINFAPYVNGYHDYLQNWHNITVGWWWLKGMWLDK